ncbi:class I SAM-dependent methyltransferase [Alkalilacustris brevis]|uniref:class I SAM-dependent methyltransferase n=1 Tax=Alkalilacustris brevis TaxID=2026338 RepID=UPI000E0D86CC|nr:class I SAM-dependent methyltransferase [Alkalilacustris brevis]
MNEAFFTLHDDLPREGPGDRESLDWAMGVARVPQAARILDAGCGPGADIRGLLEHAPRGKVLALDLHPGFAERASAGFEDDPRVTARAGDMMAVEGPFDLIWSAGTIYFEGVRQALEGWRDALAPGGKVVFSELVWRNATPPEPTRAFWAAEYPDMTDEAGLRDEIAAAGYRLLDCRYLPASAWEAYYGPLEERMDELEAEGPDDDIPGLAEVIAAHRREIAIWRAHGDSFGYLLCVTEPA